MKARKLSTCTLGITGKLGTTGIDINKKSRQVGVFVSLCSLFDLPALVRLLLSAAHAVVMFFILATVFEYSTRCVQRSGTCRSR